LSDLNIFFGENDVGKSNIMRALNLFFNDEVEPGFEFDFDIDFSAKRASEADAPGDVRSFAYVKIWFNSPPEHRRALGESFYVKRTWSDSTLPSYRQEYSRHIDSPGRQQSLTKFLAKIKFTYIPAVKDRTVYSGLLTDAYEAIAQTAAFEAALQAFTDEIRNQTRELSGRIDRSLGMSSALSPPTDLGELFASLDFETLAGAGDRMSLIRQRGDGVQARHIPEILSFIADRDAHQYHIWGIEEPENSLSIPSAVKLSERLKEISTESSMQLFITTHSPTFYALGGEGVRKFFLKRSASGDVESVDGTTMPTSTLMEVMGDEFYLPIISEAVAKASAGVQLLKQSVNDLTAQIENQNKPILFVEGPSDATLVAHLLSFIQNDWQVALDVVSLDGASHAERLSSMTQPLVRKLLNGRRGFVLLDSDRAGRSALPKSINRQAAGRDWVSSTNSIEWRLLSPSQEAISAFNAAGINDLNSAGVCLEDCYSSETRQAALDARVYETGPPRDFVHTKADLFAVSPALTDAAHKFYLLEPQERTKMSFVRWLIDRGHARCPLLEGILVELLARLR
jgi:predicted ATPase